MGDIRRLGSRNGVELGRDNAEPEVDARETSESSKIQMIERAKREDKSQQTSGMQKKISGCGLFGLGQYRQCNSVWGVLYSMVLLLLVLIFYVRLTKLVMEGDGWWWRRAKSTSKKWYRRLQIRPNVENVLGVLSTARFFFLTEFGTQWGH